MISRPCRLFAVRGAPAGHRCQCLHNSSDSAAKRLGEMNRSMFYGLAVDDAHEYRVWGPDEVSPGRGWVMVKSAWLTPSKITEARKRGDFHNNTGVTLRSLEITPTDIELEIEPQAGVEYLVSSLVRCSKESRLSTSKPQGKFTLRPCS